MSQAEDTRRRNQAAFWNEKQDKAKTPEDRVAVWFDACRMLARTADKHGRPPLWDELATHLHGFFKHYGG